MNTLQSSIINYEITRKLQLFGQSKSQQQYHQNEDETDDHYFIDRQYRRDESSYDRRDESSSDRRVEFFGDEYRDSDRSNDRFQNRRSKKCFV
jgi:hypothetical protein